MVESGLMSHDSKQRPHRKSAAFLHLKRRRVAASSRRRAARGTKLGASKLHDSPDPGSSAKDSLEVSKITTGAPPGRPSITKMDVPRCSNNLWLVYKRVTTGIPMVCHRVQLPFSSTSFRWPILGSISWRPNGKRFSSPGPLNQKWIECMLPHWLWTAPVFSCTFRYHQWPL